MLPVLLFLGIVALVSIGAALSVNRFHDWREGIDEPLGSINIRRFCEKGHSWGSCKFMNKADLPKYALDPTAFKGMPYCKDCGVVPSMEKMIKPKFLAQLLIEEARNEKIQEDGRIVEKLKQEWLDNSGYTGNIVKLHFEDGFAYCEKFVEELPRLMREYREKKDLDTPK